VDVQDLLALDEVTAVPAVRHLLVQLTAAEDAVEVAERRAAGIKKLIEAVVEMFPEAEDELPEEFDGIEQPRPRGAEAVKRLLENFRGQYFSVAELVRELDRVGWLPKSSTPANAVRTAAERLVEQEKIEKLRNRDATVTYGIPAPSPYDGEEPF
jgi:hypothetical protein